MARILLTGFGPFGNHETNRTGRLATMLHGSILDLPDPHAGWRVPERIAQTEVVGLELPVDGSASDIVQEHIGEVDSVLMLGLCATCDTPRLERLARNRNAFTIPDASGRVAEGIIDPKGSDLTSTAAPHRWPLETAPVPVQLSTDAGGYICNEAYYGVLSAQRNDASERRILFLHVPLEAGLDDVAFQALVEWSLALLVHPPLVEVAAGLLMDDEGRLLACRRSTERSWPGWWEFPGGKIEVGETPRQALVRELKEELSIDVNDDDLQNFGIEYHRYPEVDVRMHLFIVRSWSGTLACSAHDALRWLDRDRLSEVRWLPADGPILDRWSSMPHPAGP